VVKTSTQGAVLVFTIDGPLNLEEAGRLREAVATAPRVGRPQWVIDLAETPLIDSAGCEALLDARDSVVTVGGGVYLAALSPLCRDILIVTGAIRYFQVFEGVKQAVGQFSR
jgi:anti-anti-sigma factor